MQLWQIAMLIAGGAVAGFIDSIAGGGGLITLPLLGIFLGPTAFAIGTNKIVGATGALVALWVYARAGYLRFRDGVAYVICIALGSVTGSILTPWFSPSFLHAFIVGACGLIALMVATKPYWWPTEERRAERRVRSPLWLYMAGLIVGCYDGAIGPGGGTFMLLALLLFSQFSLLESLTLSKLANTASAGFSLVSYALQGKVVFLFGAFVAIGMACGSWIGASLALRNAERLIRPLLLAISALLLWRLSRA